MTVDPSTSNTVGCSDADLLRAVRHSGDNAALTTLVRRHHRLVMGVCRQLLGAGHDAEDAYQATFMLLIRKSRQIRNSAALTSWLYTVAFRVASRIRQQRVRQNPLDFEPLGRDTEDPWEAVALRDQHAALHRAIVGLPESLRRPVVLRYFLGQSNQQVARQLAISEAAVEGRLKRAKSRLRRQLTRRGLPVAAALATLPLACEPSTASEPLITATVQRCRNGWPSTASSTQLTSDTIYKLITKETSAMWKRQLVKWGLVAGIGCASIGLAVYPQMHRVARAGDTVVISDADGESDEGAEVTLTHDVPAQKAETRTGNPPREGGEPVFSMRTLMASERKLQTALRSPTRIDFFEIPLDEALQYVAQLHGIQFAIDQAALDELGISGDIPVSGQFQDIRLKSALNLLLRPVGLTYIIRDEVLTITTPETANSETTIQLYPFNPAWPITLEQLGDTVTGGIHAETWDDVGGEGFLYEYEGGLAVSQTQRVHDQIVELLEQLQRHAEAESRQ